MSYSETYIQQREITSMSHTISNARAAGYTPPEALQAMEEGTTLLDRLLREAVTPEEHILLELIDALVDEEDAFRIRCMNRDPKRSVGKLRDVLRAHLRQMFTGQGFSERRFYAAFHGIEKRMAT